MSQLIAFLALSLLPFLASAQSLTPVLSCVYPFQPSAHTLHGNWYGQGHLKMMRMQLSVANPSATESEGQIKIFGIDQSHHVVNVKVLNRVQVIRSGAFVSINYSPYSPTTQAQGFTMLVDAQGRAAVRTQGVPSTLNISCRSN